MKRGTEEDQQDAEAKRIKLEQEPSNDAADAKVEPKDSLTDGQVREAAAAAKQERKQEQQDTKQESSDEDDAPIQLPVSTTRSAVRKGHECPYLDTIMRQVGAAVDDKLPLAAACTCSCNGGADQYAAKRIAALLALRAYKVLMMKLRRLSSWYVLSSYRMTPADRAPVAVSFCPPPPVRHCGSLSRSPCAPPHA
jgi:hypothetical protein